jgi:hypothetical protein
MAATRADIVLIEANLETIRDIQQTHETRLNAIEGRLATLERHTKLVKARYSPFTPEPGKFPGQ